jgi:hypothetical protein
VPSRVYVDDDGVVHLTAPEEVTEEEARAEIGKMVELLEEIPFERRRVLADVHRMNKVTLGARKAFFELTGTDFVPKVAVVVSSTYQKVLVSMFLEGAGVSRKEIKIFADEGEALKWLK